MSCSKKLLNPRSEHPLIYSRSVKSPGFPCHSAGKESACNAEDLILIPGLGSSSGEGKSYLLQYSSLENSMDCIVHGVTKSQTWLSDFHVHISVRSPGATWVCNWHQKKWRVVLWDWALYPWNLQVDRVRTEMNFRTPSWCPQNCLVVCGGGTCSHTLELDPEPKIAALAN